MLDKIIIQESGTLLDVLQTINNNGKGVAFVVKNDTKFVGILTDGDIRRLLLEGKALSAPVKGLANTNCTIAHWELLFINRRDA